METVQVTLNGSTVQARKVMDVVVFDPEWGRVFVLPKETLHKFIKGGGHVDNLPALIRPAAIIKDEPPAEDAPA